jgi:hypothetical protein
MTSDDELNFPVRDLVLIAKLGGGHVLAAHEEVCGDQIR